MTDESKRWNRIFINIVAITNSGLQGIQTMNQISNKKHGFFDDNDTLYESNCSDEDKLDMFAAKSGIHIWTVHIAP